MPVWLGSGIACICRSTQPAATASNPVITTRAIAAGQRRPGMIQALDFPGGEVRTLGVAEPANWCLPGFEFTKSTPLKPDSAHAICYPQRKSVANGSAGLGERIRLGVHELSRSRALSQLHPRPAAPRSPFQLLALRPLGQRPDLSTLSAAPRAGVPRPCQTVAAPRPPSATGIASSSPGQGGLVKQAKTRAARPAAANWNAHPAGTRSASPGLTSIVCPGP